MNGQYNNGKVVALEVLSITMYSKAYFTRS